MKKVTKFFMVALLAGVCSLGYAQDYLGDPKPKEKVLGFISIERTPYTGFGNKEYATKYQWYMGLFEKAQAQYPNKEIDLRNVVVGQCCPPSDSQYHGGNDPQRTAFKGPASAKVVETGGGSPESQSMESLSKSMDKALRNVREGSRVAIDMVTVSGGVSINREDLKDQIIDALLDKGYKVVAKDYLEKLYEEQEAQQSGIYNENTTVKDNNFSAVGYYINVKVTETSLRVQVVNVSTGEYEGNATVNF